MTKKKSVTIWDVARQAEVSGKTVSRVLNNEPTVDQETRKRVLETMANMGYIPNIQARRLKSGRSMVLGLLFRDATWAYLNDVIVGSMQVAQAAGYTIMPHTFEVDIPQDREAFLQLITLHQLDGLIFTPPCDNSVALLGAIQELHVPFVRLTPLDRSLPLPHVTASDFRGAKQITEHLIHLGHQRIGHLVGNPQHQASHDRLAGYRAALESNGLSFDPDLVRQGDWGFETGKTLAGELLSLPHPPSAIFAGNDDMAAGVLAAAYCKGLDIPGNVSVAGFDDVPLAHQVWPPLTTVRQPIREIANLATRLLLDTIGGKPVGTWQYELPTELIIRESTGPAFIRNQRRCS